MKKYITICCVALLSLGLAQAQTSGSIDTDGSSVDYTPKKGDFTGAILFGRGNFMTNVNVPIQPGSNSQWTLYGNAPYANTVSNNTNNITNIAGGEARYFIMDNIAVKLVGGFLHRSTPALQNMQQFHEDENGDLVPGNDPNSSNAVWIPHYSSIEEDKITELYLTAGGEYHFPSRFNRLSPYVGLNLNYYYANTTQYDPTVIYSGSYDVDDINEPLIYDVGARQATTHGFGFQLVGGADFYLLKGLYIGFEVRPLTFIHARSQQLPAPGLEVLEAQNSTWAAFTQTHFKIGIRI
ncbi:BT1926 family outer membrane beta-barrel protein [Flagellimonas sp. GZD32]|uniref:BT1926 family outer membrane beta-barrel protein n=1 Tax=Flagellimonas cixiensis TaxID=3228750 RepID=UPI0035C887D0